MKYNEFSKPVISTSSLSDLVELGILSKPISEFTNDDIGTEVSIPYSNTGGIISGPIVFEVVGVNHNTSAKHQQTITLMTKNIIRYVAFDAKEPNNQNPDRRDFGNNRWSVSNIRQWLNSSGPANLWFKPQHDYDEAPTTDKIDGVDSEYADEPGFLAGFSPEILQHFTYIANITALYKVDGSGYETTVDKVFLPSYTEMFGYKNNGIAEGCHLSVRFPNDNSRIKQYDGYSDWYWLRSHADDSCSIIAIFPRGRSLSGYAFTGACGITPLIVLH